MSRERIVADAVAALGADLGIPALALDASRRASFCYDGVQFTLSYATEPAEVLWLYVDLGDVEADNPQMLQCLMQMGYATWFGNCMTIGLNEAGERGIGSSGIPVVWLNPDRLTQLVKRMLAAAAEVRERLTTGHSEPVWELMSLQ